MKMKFKLTFLLYGLLAMFSFSGNAQESYTLQQLIERVLSENYQVKIVSNESEIAQNNNSLGNAGFLPTLDAEGQQKTNINSVTQELANGDINTGDNARNTSLSGLVALNWTVFDGFKMFATRDQLALLADVSQNDARYFIEQTISDVATIYYQLVKEQSLLENYAEALSVSRFRHQLEQKKKAIGSSTALLYNQAKADYLADSALIVEQKNTIRNLEIQINQLVNNELDQRFQAAESRFEVTPLEAKETLLENAIQSNRDLKRAFIEELIAETNKRMEQAARYPQVDLFADYSYSKSLNEVGFIRSNQNVGPGFGVSVRFNLYNGGNTNRSIKNAEINRENATLNQKSTTQLVQSAVLTAYYRYNSALEQLAIAQAQVNATKASLNIAQQRYQAGAINGFDFRQTQISVLNAQNTVVQMQFAIKSAEIELARLSGSIMDKTL